MVELPHHHSQRLAGILPELEDIRLFMWPRLTLTFEVTTPIGVEIPSLSKSPFKVEVIEEIPLPHFNPPLLDTLSFGLQEVFVTDSVMISPHRIVMSSVSETWLVVFPISTISSVQGGLSVSSPISSTSVAGVPSTTQFPAPLSLWIIPLIHSITSLVQSTIGQPMITSRPSMSSLQSSIGPNPAVNPTSGHLPSFGTPLDSVVMCSTCFPFKWNWNSGVSAIYTNPTMSVPSSSGVSFPMCNNVSRALPFLRGSHVLRSFQSLKVFMSLVGHPFLAM